MNGFSFSLVLYYFFSDSFSHSMRAHLIVLCSPCMVEDHPYTVVN